MAQYKVLVPVPVFSAKCVSAVELLNRHGVEVKQNTFGQPFQMERFSGVLPEIDAVIAGTEPWCAPQLNRLPKLKVIARFGVGLDNIDISAASERGIVCTKATGGSTRAVAELAVTLMLSALRKVPELDARLKSGLWKRSTGMELNGKTVGIIGFGAIGQTVARILSSFDVTLVAFDAFPNRSAAAALNVTLLETPEAVLKSADIVTLHVPALPSTDHFMNRERLAAMKEGAHLVNTSRGAVVDEEALYEALASGRIAGAASDVFETEPAKPDNKLLTLPSFIGLPHIGADTEEALYRVGMMCAQAVVDCLEGRTPENVVKG